MSDNEHHTTQEVDGGDKNSRTEENTAQPDEKQQVTGEPRYEKSFLKEVGTTTGAKQ